MVDELLLAPIDGIVERFARPTKQANPAPHIHYKFCARPGLADFLFALCPSLPREELPWMARGVLSSNALATLQKHVRCDTATRDAILEAFPVEAAAVKMRADAGIRVTHVAAFFHRMRQYDAEVGANATAEELRREVDIIRRSAPPPRPRRAPVMIQKRPARTGAAAGGAAAGGLAGKESSRSPASTPTATTTPGGRSPGFTRTKPARRGGAGPKPHS